MQNWKRLYPYPGEFAFKAGMQWAILFSPSCCSRCCQPHLRVPPVFGLLQSGREGWLPLGLIWLVINPKSCLIPACYRNSVGFEITYQNCFLLFCNAELSVPSKATAGAWGDRGWSFRGEGNYGIELCIQELVLMVETETGEATPCLGTCSCQQEIFLFASDPVWILYLPYCELLKGHSLLTFYKPQSCSIWRWEDFLLSLAV